MRPLGIELRMGSDGYPRYRVTPQDRINDMLWDAAEAAVIDGRDLKELVNTLCDCYGEAMDEEKKRQLDSVEPHHRR